MFNSELLFNIAVIIFAIALVVVDLLFIPHNLRKKLLPYILNITLITAFILFIISHNIVSPPANGWILSEIQSISLTIALLGYLVVNLAKYLINKVKTRGRIMTPAHEAPNYYTNKQTINPKP